MTDEGAWNIEKTNFSSIQIEQPNPEWPRQFVCIGDGRAFVSFLYEENPYRYANTFEREVDLSKGHFCSFTVPDFQLDPLNSQKKDPMQKIICLAVVDSKLSIASLFDNDFISSFKSTSFSRQFAMVYLRSQTDDLLAASLQDVQTAAEFIGATHIITVDRRKCSRDIVRKKLCDAIALQVPAKVSYLDKGIVTRQYMLALLRYGKLQLIQKQTRLIDPEFRDPLGNNVLHYGVLNDDIEVFYYMADKFPELLNEPNSEAITPVNKLLKMGWRARLLDWTRFWQLPIKFSKKIDPWTCLMILHLEPHAMEAFEALIKNERAWTKARKHHKRKVILTPLVHTLIKSWTLGDTDPTSKLPDKVEFFIKNGASIHHHKGKSLLNTAIQSGRYQTALRLLSLGSTLRNEDFSVCWKRKNAALARFLVARPEINKLSQEELNEIVVSTVQAGWTDVLRTLSKKGRCKLDLSINANGRLATANLIAQMNSPTILPLKYMCVDVIYDSVNEENRKANQKLMLMGEEAEINWSYRLADYPEEIQGLFPRKELWRWALFVQDEKKQSKILRLYQAVNLRVKDPKPAHYKTKTMALTYGKVKFCISCTDTERILWLGDFQSNSPKFVLSSVTSERSNMEYTEVFWKDQESGSEVLEEIMKACGWDSEDAYLFLHILNTSFFAGDEYGASGALFSLLMAAFRRPPQWYLELIRKMYGLEHPQRQRYIDC